MLLFPVDAQVGNRLSWQDLKWEFANRPAVTGPDQLNRLDARPANRVLRIDMDVPPALQGQVDTSDPLYYEIALPLEKGPSPA